MRSGTTWNSQRIEFQAAVGVCGVEVQNVVCSFPWHGVQHIFGKKAFKQSLKTSDKTVALTRSVPLVAKFKDEIEEARGKATHLVLRRKNNDIYSGAAVRSPRRKPRESPDRQLRISDACAKSIGFSAS